MHIIGLTGGIASGKSTVSSLLSGLGAFIIDADKIARRVVEPGKPAWQKIAEHFGPEVFHADGALNRRRLGDIVFTNKSERKYLESLTHPAIQKEVETEIDKANREGHSLVVLDVPLLLESDWVNMVDAVWVVYVNRDTQLTRLMARDNLVKAEAEARIASQLSLEEKKNRADLVIDNNGSPADTREQVERAWRRVTASLRNS